jgi:hypothetical protein
MRARCKEREKSLDCAAITRRNLKRAHLRSDFALDKNAFVFAFFVARMRLFSLRCHRFKCSPRREYNDLGKKRIPKSVTNVQLSHSCTKECHCRPRKSMARAALGLLSFLFSVPEAAFFKYIPSFEARTKSLFAATKAATISGRLMHLRASNSQFAQ